MIFENKSSGLHGIEEASLGACSTAELRIKLIANVPWICIIIIIYCDF